MVLNESCSVGRGKREEGGEREKEMERERGAKINVKKIYSGEESMKMGRHTFSHGIPWQSPVRTFDHLDGLRDLIVGQSIFQGPSYIQRTFDSRPLLVADTITAIFVLVVIAR